jgi:hypothetical protein
MYKAPTSMKDLLEALRKIEEAMSDLPTIAKGPAKEELKALMDKYDISNAVTGSGRRSTSHPSVYERAGSGLILPLQPYIPQPLTFSARYWGTSASSIVHDEDAKRIDQERKHRISQFEASITCAASASPIKLDNPGADRVPSPAPDYIHTLTGWRGWGVRHGMLLHSVGSNFPWTPRKAVPAVCFAGDRAHSSPHVACSCGYWAFKSSELMTKALHDYVAKGQGVFVVGTVELWGKVIECENGFRAEFSYPKELWLLKPGLDNLSWKYGVPVRKI